MRTENQGRAVKPQAEQRHPERWQNDLNPNHLAGQNIGRASEAAADTPLTAFHLRKAGLDLATISDSDLKQVPVLNEGTRLQQGATYVNLSRQPVREITARADMTARASDAYVPKDRVPYEIRNRQIRQEKPGQG